MKRDLAVTQRLNVLETARLYALADVTGTDGAIACANDKEFWHFWRPITAIRSADTDGNPATTADPDWTPLVVTPPNPDYPSGHTCRTAAQMTAYARFFGRDNVSFSAFSVDSGTTRHFDSFSQATAEVVGARIWAGIHFRSADVDGTKLGTAVGKHISRRYFQPRRQRCGIAGLGGGAWAIRLDSPMSTTQLAMVTGYTPPSVHDHLTVLHEAGLVDKRRAGRSVLYWRTHRRSPLRPAQHGIVNVVNIRML